MTRIEFYFNADSKSRAACQLVARALERRLRVLIYAPDETVARGVEEALRALPAIHSALGPESGEAAPVLISGEADAASHDEVLLNLHDGAPRHFSRYRQVIEVVARAEDDRQAARERFRYYRDRGYAIRHYDMALGRT